MKKRNGSLSIEDRHMIILWATSAARCWLVLSAGAVLAALAHLIHAA